MICRPAGGYLMCPECKTIVRNDNYTKETALDNPNNPFPGCGHKSVRELWPRWDVLSLIDDFDITALRYEEDITKIKLIFYCSSFDFLFETFLVNFLEKANTQSKLIDYILDTNSEFPKRVALFNKLSGEKLKEILKNNGFSDFGEQQRFLRKKRNELVHKTFDIDFDVLNECFEIIERDMLKVFVFLHNKYISIR